MINAIHDHHDGCQLSPTGLTSVNYSAGRGTARRGHYSAQQEGRGRVTTAVLIGLREFAFVELCGRGGVGRTRVWCEARIFGAKIKRVYAHAPPPGALCQQNNHLATDE